MSVVITVWALLLFTACAVLLFHPLLKHLALSEVPAAVLVCLCGRRYRRALAGILVRRRLAARRPAPPPRPEKVKLPGPVTAACPGTGPHRARLMSAAIGSLPASPAARLNAELAAHRARLDEIARCAWCRQTGRFL